MKQWTYVQHVTTLKEVFLYQQKFILFFRMVYNNGV